jgi:hypothetical protein
MGFLFLRSWRSYYGFIDMTDDFEQTLSKKVDLLPIENLYGTTMKKYFSSFMNNVTQEIIILYEKS